MERTGERKEKVAVCTKGSGLVDLIVKALHDG